MCYQFRTMPNPGPLFLRPTVIGGDSLADDYSVIHDGRRIGRIRKATERQGSRDAIWDWMINIPLPIPPGCTGSAGDLDAAKDAFNVAWAWFLPTLTAHDIQHWHHHQDAAEDRWR
jgi:hypothetical protein